MRVELASSDDVREILELQKLAYLSEAETYGDYSLPPLTQTLEQIRDDFKKQLFLKVVTGARIVGSVRGRMEQATCHVGRLIVHPDFQNRGIGTLLTQKIEERFKQAQRYELFTGNRSERNLRLYQKLGYRPFRTKTVSDNLTLVFLEKMRGTV